MTEDRQGRAASGPPPPPPPIPGFARPDVSSAPAFESVFRVGRWLRRLVSRRPA
ncbi:MAG TPA: hypothetical protein VF520_00990 [Thermoleophilaceae bacterium]